MIHIKSLKSFVGFFVLSLLTVAAVVVMPSSASAYVNPAVVNLGEAGNFAVLSSTAISDVPTSVITGDIGVSPAAATAITGFTCPAVTGTVHVVSAGGPTLACQTVDPEYLTPTVVSYEAAYTDAQGRTADATISTALDGLTYTPGVYTAADLDLNNGSTVTLDCGGDANGVFIFQTAGHLNIGTSANVDLIGSCQPGNVFWAVAGVTNIHGGVSTPSTFQGTVLGGQGVTEISLEVGSTVLGRLMSDKTISLQGNIITVPTTTPPPTDPVFIDLDGDNVLDSGEQHFTTVQAAVSAAVDNDMIVVTEGTYEFSTQLNISRPLSITGVGTVTLKAVNPTWSNVNGSKHLLGIYSGTESNPVTISNIILDADSKSHAVNTYSNAYGVLNNVTIKNGKGAGLTVNGSTINATNLNTSGNAWGAVNVDPGIGVTAPSVFTLNSGTLAESTQIWSDGDNVSGIATVTVNATGYNMYKKGGTSAFYVWTDRALTGVATIASAPTVFYTTIQAAISAASTTAMDTINVGAGTYTEVGQIVIDKDLSIVGVASTTVVIKTNADTGNVGDAKGWFLVSPGKVFNIKNVTLDGAGFKVYQAIRHNGIGVIENVKFTNIKYEESGPAYQGTGVEVVTTGNIDVKNCEFSEMGRYGVQIYWDSPAATGAYSGNTYTGKGNGNWLDYAFEIGAGSHVTIDGNIISNNTGVATFDGSDSAAISVWDDVGTQAVITNNKFNNNHIGVAVAVFSGNTADPVVTIGSGNTFNGGDYGVDVQSVGATGFPTLAIANSVFSSNTTGVNVAFGMTVSNITINNSSFLNSGTSTANSGIGILGAANNWWGTASSTEFAMKILGSVNYAPWYINPGRTVLSSSVGDVAGAMTITASTIDFAETADGAVVLPEGTSGLILSDSSVLDFLASANTAIGGNIIIDGSSVSLASFTLGDASVVNLSTPQTIGGQSITVDMAVKLSSGSSTEPIIITNSSMPNVSVSIPDDTTILAPSGWTGTMQPPKTGSSSGTAPSGFTVGGTVISVGSPDVVLIFDKPVTVTLTGVTGTVGYKPAGSSTWTTIGTTCTGTYENPTGATFPGECKITNGTDTKILTYHFTTFGGFDPIPPTPTPTPAPVGGGGPVGLFGVVTNNSAGVQNAQAVVAQTPAVTNAATPTPRGQVLGVSTFRFTKPLAVGSRGEEVTELQNRLIAEGLLSSEATGYYGSLTAQAVKAFQAKYGIGQAGIVGPQTREKLNAGGASVDVTVPGCESGNKFNTTTGEVCKAPSAGSQFGAAVSAFARTLSQGSTGDEVKSLQERLTKEGVYTGPITGYFGSLTRAAVEAYQEMKGLEKAGVVGPKTRAELNK